jgi:hypothetical protein
MRQASAHPTENGGHLHHLGASTAPSRRAASSPPPVSPNHATPRASAAVRGAVYTTMLRDVLKLSDAHRAKLRARGLDDAEIEARGYRSTPGREEAAEVMHALAGHDLRGVPGFYGERDRCRIVNTAPGYFVPYRDEQGRVAAMQYRLDVPRGDGHTKYLWFSSPPAQYSGGTSSAAPLHHARPELLASAREITLTEGAIKTDIASFLMGAPMIAAAGVTLFGRDFAAHLRRLAPELQTVYVAFDLDWQTNETVKRALFRLLAELEAARLSARLRAWPPHLGKGIDDYLLAFTRGGYAA